LWLKLRWRDPCASTGFALLWLGGRDFRGLPIFERESQLRILIGKPGAVRYVEHFACGRALFREVCERDMEGIVAKRARAPYDADEPS
jgi:bifunctional non-homologous end joining protein LigD